MITNNIFYLESFVFIFHDDTNVLLYNSITYDSVEFSTTQPLLQFILKLDDPSNMRRIKISKEIMEDQSVYYFIEKVRELFWGDLIDKELLTEMPVIIPPICNFQKDKEVDAHNAFSYLNEVRIVTDISPSSNVYLYKKIFNQTQLLVSDELISELSIEILNKILSALPSKCHLTFLGTDIMSYFSLHNVFSLIPNLPRTTICVDYLKFAWNTNFQIFDFKIVITFPIQKEILKNIIRSSNKLSSTFTYIFLVLSEDEYEKVDAIANELHIFSYELIPIYNDNIHFFEKFVFNTPESLLESCISKDDIFQHQIFNSYDFGKIIILPNGNIKGNPYLPTWGNIMSADLRELTSNEIKYGKSWLRLREQGICNTYRYKWICPSPSNYEFEIGKQNLCHIKQ